MQLLGRFFHTLSSFSKYLHTRSYIRPITFSSPDVPISPFTLQYREHFLPSFFFPSTPLLKVICVTSLLVLHLPSSTESISVLPSFFLYTPFTGYMCHIAPCFLFFQIPLTAISILPFFFLSLHPLTVYDVPLRSISPYTFLNTAQRAFSSCLPLSLSTLLLQYWNMPLLLVYHFSICLPEQQSTLYREMYQFFPLSVSTIFTPYTIDMFLCFLFSISSDTPQITTQRNVSWVTLFSFTIKRIDMRDKLILLPSFLTYLSISILLSI